MPTRADRSGVTDEGAAAAADRTVAPSEVDVPTTPPPAWFTAALASPPRSHHLEVDGADVHALVWEPARTPAPTLVLVHGGAAHAGWWRALAPAFLPAYRVVAVDLSGHGDSEHREAYRFGGWVEEVLAVGRDLADEAGFVLVGHSMGGVVAAMAAAVASDPLAAVVVDAPLRGPEHEEVTSAEAVFRTVKRYASPAEGQARFRILPAQPVLHPALLAQVAAESLRRDGSTWTWKYDRGVFASPATGRPADLGGPLADARVPVAAVVGERSSIVDAEDRDRWRELTAAGSSTRYLEVAGGHHHLMFDRPLELVAALGRLLADLGLPEVDASG